MRIAPPPRRVLPEPLLPMINVVFLLLIFFLLAATLARPAPFAVTPPHAAEGTEPQPGPLTLYLDAAGQPGFEGITGAPALQALAQAARDRRASCGDCADRLDLRADAGLPGAVLAELVTRLSGMGFASVALVVRMR